MAIHTLIAFDVFVFSYLSALLCTVGIRVDKKATLLTSIPNMFLIRVWAGYMSSLLAFQDSHVLLALPQMIVCYLMQDFYGYAIHRFMHWNKFVYLNVHAQHHENLTECWTTAFYIHPFELVGFYFIGLMIGPVTLQYLGYLSVSGLTLWMCSATFFLTWSHTGLNVPHMPDTTFHELHHRYCTVNFGTTLTDYVFDTAYWT